MPCLCSTVITIKIKLLFGLIGRTGQNSKATKEPALVICRLPLISPKYSIKISKTRSILRAVILAWKLTPLIVNFLSTMGCYTPLFLVLLPPSYRIAPPTDPSTPSYNLFPLPFFVQSPTVRAPYHTLMQTKGSATTPPQGPAHSQLSQKEIVGPPPLMPPWYHGTIRSDVSLFA